MGRQIMGRLSPARVVGAVVAVLATSCLLLALSAGPASASTLIVRNTDDSGKGSLRKEIARASSGDEIVFADSLKGKTITLTSGQLTIDKDLTITGPGAGQLAVSGNDSSRVFDIPSGNEVGISGLTITDGDSGNDSGGGIRNDRGSTLTLSEVSVNDNRAKFDGGISNNGTMTLTDSAVTGNTAEANGGVGNAGEGTAEPSTGGNLTVERTTISDNTATSFGAGGITNNDGTLTVEDSTISGNTTTFYGGGIFSITNDTGERTTIINSTVSGNSASETGGGIYNEEGLTEIENSTITQNTAPQDKGSGVASFGWSNSTTEVFSSIIAGNQRSDVDFVDGSTNSFVSQGYNLVGDGNATGAFDQTGDQVIGDKDPRLRTLADNGGPTKTHALLFDSPAIDKGQGSSPGDQRGQGRTEDLPKRVNAPNGDGTDVGALELQTDFDSACTLIGSSLGEILRGSSGDDVICGLGGDDKLYGFDGDDVLRGGPGANRLVGNKGKDRLVGGSGVDRLLGQTGDDRIFGLAGDDRIRGGPDTNRLVGNKGDDRIVGGGARDVVFAQGGNDRVLGLAGDDILRGGGGNDVLLGGNGNDRLVGNEGTDRIRGQNGNDVLYGVGGNDFLTGNDGADELYGNSGRDYLNGKDRVTGNDRLNGGRGRDRGGADPGTR